MRIVTSIALLCLLFTLTSCIAETSTEISIEPSTVPFTVPSTASSVEPSTVPTAELTAEPPPIQTIIPTEVVPTDNLIDATIIYNPDITFDELKESVKLGLHVDETIKVLGEEFDTYHEEYGDHDIIRYYYANDRGYTYQYTQNQHMQVQDFDMEGLLNSKIKYKLYIATYEGIVSFYALAYKHQDGKVHSYYEYSNGYTKEDIWGADIQD